MHLTSGTKNAWDEACNDTIGQVQTEPRLVKYIQGIYGNPQRFSGYILVEIEGNLQCHGSAHVEQNHSSIVSHLGRRAS